MQTPLEVRLALKAADFSIVALRSKRPLEDAWQTKLDISDEEIRRMPGGNTGTHTRYTPALDIDILDHLAAELSEDLVRHWLKERGKDGVVLVRTGLAPKRLIPFRTAVPFPKMAVNFAAPDGSHHKLELLADGQQFVVHGIHPDIKQPYLWEEHALWDLSREDLPELSEDEAHGLIGFVAAALEEDLGFKRIVGGNGATNGNGAPAADISEMGPGNIHHTQVATIASRLRNGMSLDMAVQEVLEETQRVGDPTWNWEREERDIRGQGLAFITKNPELATALPDEMRPAFEAMVAQGVKPRFKWSRASRWQLLGIFTAPPGPKAQTAAPAQQRGPQLILRRAGDITPEPIDWVWFARLARGKQTNVAGEPGLGKSQFGIYTAAAVTNGAPWPCSEGQATRGRIIILSAEDDAEDTIVPRLIAAGADLNMVEILHAVDQQEKGKRTFNLQTDLPLLERAIEEMGDVQLALIDPVSAYFGKGDSHRDTEVRTVLAPLTEMAGRQDVALLTIAHFNKGSGPNVVKAINKIMGSIAFAAAPRMVYAITSDPDDEDRRLLLHVKNNLTAPAQGLAFRIEQTDLPGAIQTSHIVWDREPVNITADEAVASRKTDHAPALEEAKQFLNDLVGPAGRDVKEIEVEAKAAGISMATIRRAKDELKLVSKKGGLKGGWVWKRQA